MPVLLAPRSWGAHLLLVLALLATGWLGLWQWHGWQDRRAAEVQDLTHATPVALTQVFGPDDPFPASLVGQPVEVAGSWLPDTLYIAGRTHGGRDGYWVVGAVQVGSSVLPAVRGWSASPSGVPAESGSADFVGWLQPSEADDGTPDPDPTDDVYPQLRVADLAQHFDEDLYGGYVVLRDPDAGLARADLEQLPDPSRFTAVRNLLYAFEWWFFGAFAVFVWWRWARETVELTRAEEQATPEVPAGDGR